MKTKLMEEQQIEYRLNSLETPSGNDAKQSLLNLIESTGFESPVGFCGNYCVKCKMDCGQKYM